MSGKEWICNQCNYKTHSSFSLYSHKKFRHLAVILRYKCSYCYKKEYSKKFVLKKHVEIKHPISVIKEGYLSCIDPATLEVIDNPKKILLDARESTDDKLYIAECTQKAHNKAIGNNTHPNTSHIKSSEVGKSKYFNYIQCYMEKCS